MPGRLEGKVAVVTGSNSGIGRGIAIGYGREGAIVICANRQAESKNPEEKITTHDLIVQNGGKAEFLPLQFTETKSIDELIAAVVAKHEKIDIWVSNAGSGSAFKPIYELTDEEFDYAIDINLKGTFRSVRSASAQMVKQGHGGSIITTTSIFGPRGWPTSTSYASGKLGVTGFIKTAAIDLAPHKIRINAIAPGTVVTSMTSLLPQEALDALSQRALLGFGSPEDIAGTAILLGGDEGRWITGQELYIDGGFTAM